MDEKTKKALQEIFMAGIRAVDPEEAVKRHVELSGSELRVGGRSYQLERFKRIFVTGFGKGTAPMAKALEQVLGERLTERLDHRQIRSRPPFEQSPRDGSRAPGAGPGRIGSHTVYSGTSESLHGTGPGCVRVFGRRERAFSSPASSPSFERKAGNDPASA